MSAGGQIDLAAINNRAAAVTRTVFAAVAEVSKFKSWLDGVTDPTLTGTYSMSAGDVADLRSAMTDLGELVKIWNGQTSTKVTGTYDFTQFTKRLIGPGVY